jgi:hypothetical protein
MRLLPAVSAAMLMIATLSMPASAAERIGGDNAFSFVALGDMPYNLPDDTAKFDRLIAAVNAMKPAFTLHMGDIKSGALPCSDEVLKTSYDQIQTFEGALVYTIGDNEWVDCHRKAAGGYNPRERLAKLRELFFANPAKSLGKTPIDVESQALLMPEFSTYVENTRFAKNGVMFLTAHVPGSNNGFEAQDLEGVQEFFARDKANVAWINASFAKASADNAKAVVMFVQAEFDESRFQNGAMPRQSGFTNTLDAIEAGAKSFGKPVLLIHGDEHYFSIAPLRNSKGKPIPGVNKLMVYGDTLVHAVRVFVDPDGDSVFGFMPLIVPENGMGK